MGIWCRLVALGMVVGGSLTLWTLPIVAADADEATLRVPAEFSTIQAALDAAEDGDTVLVSPGVYHESLVMEKKNVILASEFLSSGDPAKIKETILDGTTKSDDGSEEVLDCLIEVKPSIGPGSKIVGFTIRNGDDGIACYGSLTIVNNRFEGNEDAIDYEGGGGLCRDNVFENNKDDAVDFDQATSAEVTNNIIRNNEDDGIEIRLHNHQGDQLRLVICDNIIAGNGEDGIQIISYPRRTNRVILIERNMIARNAMAGIGCMSNGNTKENYEGAPVGEPVFVVNNTIAENEFGVVGGYNLAVVSNVLVGNRQTALRKVRGNSLVRNNLFWNNGADVSESNVDQAEMLCVDPNLDENFRPQPGSPCIEAGLEEIETPWGDYELDPAMFTGDAPGLGAFEYRGEDNG